MSRPAPFSFSCPDSPALPDSATSHSGASGLPGQGQGPGPGGWYSPHPSHQHQHQDQHQHQHLPAAAAAGAARYAIVGDDHDLRR